MCQHTGAAPTGADYTKRADARSWADRAYQAWDVEGDGVAASAAYTAVMAAWEKGENYALVALGECARAKREPA